MIKWHRVIATTGGAQETSTKPSIGHLAGSTIDSNGKKISDDFKSEVSEQMKSLSHERANNDMAKK